MGTSVGDEHVAEERNIFSRSVSILPSHLSLGFQNGLVFFLVLLSLTLRLLISYIYIYIYIYVYMEHLFLMFLDHTQRRTTVGRTPLDE